MFSMSHGAGAGVSASATTKQQRKQTALALGQMARMAGDVVGRTPGGSAGVSEIEVGVDEMTQFDSILREIDAESLGVSKGRFKNLPENESGYCEVYSDSNVTMAVFVLGARTELPLHDHPGMYVFTKVLWGTLGVDSYDIVDGALRRNPVTLIAEGETGSLTPTERNMHAFSAHGNAPVCFCDVLIPPYNEQSGRYCTYWHATDDGRFMGGDAPESLVMRSYPYNGVEADMQVR